MPDYSISQLSIWSGSGVRKYLRDEFLAWIVSICIKKEEKPSVNSRNSAFEIDSYV